MAAERNAAGGEDKLGSLTPPSPIITRRKRTVSIIDGEFVPHEGDLVSYRMLAIPPKLEKFQAVHVRILNFAPGRHEQWSSPVDLNESSTTNAAVEMMRAFSFDGKSDSNPGKDENDNPRKGDGEGDCQQGNGAVVPAAPPSPPHPIVSRRKRSVSTTERAARGEQGKGKVRFFCRQKGHGFVIPDVGGDDLFVHISDIDGEFVPHEGDAVSFRILAVPPKFIKVQAVHVKILNFAPGVHEKWTDPLECGEAEHERHKNIVPNTPEGRGEVHNFTVPPPEIAPPRD